MSACRYCCSHFELLHIKKKLKIFFFTFLTRQDIHIIPLRGRLIIVGYIADAGWLTGFMLQNSASNWMCCSSGCMIGVEVSDRYVGFNTFAVP